METNSYASKLKKDEKKETYNLNPIPNAKQKKNTGIDEFALNSVAEIDELTEDEITEQYTSLGIVKLDARYIPSHVKLRRLKVHRLLLRGVTRQEIAKHFGVSADTIYKDCVHITRALKEELQSVDLPAFVATTVSFYDDLRQTAHTMSGDKNIKPSDRLRALEVSLKIEDSKQNYLGKMGLYGEANKNLFEKTEREQDPAEELLSSLGELLSMNVNAPLHSSAENLPVVNEGGNE